jgi:hypothetical protein
MPKANEQKYLYFSYAYIAVPVKLAGAVLNQCLFLKERYSDGKYIYEEADSVRTVVMKYSELFPEVADQIHTGAALRELSDDEI